MKAAIREVTPAMAEVWLGKNPLNRNVRLNRVEEYAADMEAGDWKVNGESIILDADGNLIDGQHRLLAILFAGKSIQSLVVEGVETTAKSTIDTGMKRSLADVLKMQGENNVHSLAAAVTMAFRWEHGGLRDHTPATRAQALNWLEENPAIRDALKLAAPITIKPLRMPPSIAAPLLFFAESVSTFEDVATFVEQVATGLGVTEDDGSYRLRMYLLNSASENNYTGSTRGFVKLALAVKAWNAYIDGTPVKVLRWRAGGAAAEDFPVLRGNDGRFFNEGPARQGNQARRRGAQPADTAALAETIKASKVKG